MLVSMFMSVISVTSVIVHGRTSNNHVVHTDKGDVRGHIIADYGYKYVAYLGIRYAEAMNGMRRFQAPLPALPWSGVFEAKRKVLCDLTSNGNEDCLIINVFVPLNATKIGDLPVLFLVHGGSFLYTSSRTGGFAPLIKHQLILVTPNYRLGALGFLCLRNKQAPGNAGLKDIVAALKWVKKNISNFGGNPNMVTIYGYSAGAVLVEALVLSRMSSGLFRAAIIESGSALNYWATDVDPVSTALTVATEIYRIYGQKVEVNMNNVLELYLTSPVWCLRGQNEYHKRQAKETGMMAFAPCVENSNYGIQPFLTEHPRDILIEKNYKPVSILFIFSTLEAIKFRGDYMESSEFRRALETRFEDFFPPDLVFENITAKKNIADYVKHAYVGKNNGSNTPRGYLNFLGDIQVTYGFLKSAKLHSRNSRVYLMEFAYKGYVGFSSPLAKRFKKGVHADLFKHIFCGMEPKGDDRKAVTESRLIVANFVKYGDPKVRATNGSIWPPVQPGKPMAYLHFDRQNKVLSDPYRRRMELWRAIYNKYGVKTKHSLEQGKQSLKENI